VSERVREISGNSEFYPDTLGFGENSRHWTEYAGVWGLSPQQGPGHSPWSGGLGDFSISSEVLRKYSIWILCAIIS